LCTEGQSSRRNRDPYVDLSTVFIDLDHIRFLFARQDFSFLVLFVRVEQGPEDSVAFFKSGASDGQPLSAIFLVQGNDHCGVALFSGRNLNPLCTFPPFVFLRSCSLSSSEIIRSRCLVSFFDPKTSGAKPKLGQN
jgi:hypothetical protein